MWSLSKTIERRFKELLLPRLGIEKTLGIIKPEVASDAITVEAILHTIEAQGLKIVAQRSLTLSEAQAREFYKAHSYKGFFPELITYMTSGPVVILIIEGKDAIARYRDLLGPTNSELARAEAPTSIRARFGADLNKNAAHGSDSAESAAREIALLFPDLE